MWTHLDNGSCAGQAVGVRTRLENGLSGFIPTKMISDKHISSPHERVKVTGKKKSVCVFPKQYSLFFFDFFVFFSGGNDSSLSCDTCEHGAVSVGSHVSFIGSR